MTYSEWRKKKREEEQKSALTSKEKAMGGINNASDDIALTSNQYSFEEWLKNKSGGKGEEESMIADNDSPKTFAEWSKKMSEEAATQGQILKKPNTTKVDSYEEWRKMKRAEANGEPYSRGGNKDAIFKSGGFDDGVDGVKDFFGDLLETTAGTLGDAILGIVQGARSGVEGIEDELKYVAAGISDLAGNDLHAERLRAEARRNVAEEEYGWMRDTFDETSVLGNPADTLIEIGGQQIPTLMAGPYGLLVTGISGAGIATNAAYADIEAMGDAYTGNKDLHAFLYGIGSGVTAALTESIAGGLGKGVKALGISRGIGGLDDIVAKKISNAVTKAITNETAQKVLGNTLEAAVKAGGEGLEEVAEGILSAVMKKFTYASNEEWSKLIADEKLLEQFAYGAAFSAIMQGADVIKSTSNKTDFVTGMTSAEEKVINKAAEQEIAKREANGEKLTKKQKNEIYDRFAEDISRGYISIDTIEETLGGDKYTEYKKASDENDALKKELDELRNMKSGDMTDIQRDRLTELKAMNLDDTSKIDELKKQMSDDVLNLVKSERKGQGSLLMESYNEKARRGEGYTVDLNTIDNKKQDTYKRAMDAGILNNTNRTHDFVDLIATLESDRGVKIDFVNNQKLKESGFAVDGAIVNGVKTDNGILLNVESGKTLDTVVGHEIAHVLEGTELYSALQDSIIKYAQSKGDYDTRYANIAKLYKTDDDVKIKQELTADLVGDYLFTDEKFIKSLTTNPNVFQKIFNEIKYLVKIATSGSEAKRKLLEVQRAFERAWADTKATKNTTNEGGVKANTEYSLSKNARDDVHNALYNKRFEGDVKLTDNTPTIMLAHEGVQNLPMLMNASHLRENVFTEAEAKKQGLKVNPDINYHGLGETFFLEIIDDLDNVTEAYRGTKNAENSARRENYFLLISKKADKDGNIVNVPVYINDKGRYNRVFIDTNKIATVFGRSELRQYINEQLAAKNLVRIKTRSTQASEATSPINADYGMDASVDSISQNSEKSRDLENISENSDIAPTQFSLSDSNGKQLSKEQQEYFQDSKVRDENGNLKVMYHGTPNGNFTVFRDGTYFTDNKEYADRYQGTNASSISSGKVAANPKTFEVYLNIKKPFDISDAKARDIYINEYIKGGNAIGINPYLPDAEYDKISTIDWTEGEDLRDFLIDNGYDYDGLVLDEGADGGYGEDVQYRGKSYVVFSPEQVKSIDNTKPTSNPDIWYSLSSPDDIAPVGKYSNLGIQEDIAPLTMDSVDTMGGVNTKANTDSNQTVSERIAAHRDELRAELDELIRQRNFDAEDIDIDIAMAEAEYKNIKNKKSDKANNLLQEIKRLEKMKATVDSDYKKRIAELQKRINKLANMSDVGTQEMYVDPAKKEYKKANWWNTFRTHVLDDASVFEDLAKKTKNRELESKFNFIKSAEARAQSLIGNGKKEAGVKSLNSIRQTVEKTGKTADFEDYMYHLLNIDRMTLADRYEGATNKPVFDKDITADISEAKVRQYEAQNPQFKSLAEDVYKYMQYERQLMVDNGIISQETADLWQEQTPHYIPIKRSVADDSPVNISDKKKINVDSTVKRVKGGDQPIEHLFDTIASRTERVFSSIAKNNFGLELKNTLNSVIDSNVATQDDVDNGVDRHDDLLQAGKDGRNPTFTVFENGEKVTFEISHDMYEALKPTDAMWKGTSKFLSGANNLRRGLLTQYSPKFMINNPIKDIQDVLLNSQHALKTYANLPKAAKELATKGKWYTEYIENGGEQNSYFKDGKGFTKEDTGIKKLIGIPLNKISDINNFIESMPRLAEYIASRQSGASIETAMLDAARVTTNFQAGGDITKFLNRNGFTFLNASVQGLMQNVRNVREAKMNGLKGVTQLIAKTMLQGLPAILLNHLIWGDDEEYEELSDYVKDNYYIVAKYGDGKFVRIPKGRTAAVIQDAFEQMANLITGNDEVDLESFFELVMNNLAPNNPLENNIIAPLTQAWANKTWYGDDLVPTRLQDLPAKQQYDESTDAISKWLGEKTNISPYKINYVLDQYSGAVGDFVLPMLTPEAERGDNKLLAPLADAFTTDSTMKNQNVSDFYDTVDKLTVNANDIMATDEDILKSKYMNSINSELSELYKQKREIQNSTLSDAAKYNAVRDIQKQIDDLAENSLKTYNAVYVHENYARVGDRHYHTNSDGEWEKISDKQFEKMRNVTSELGISRDEYWGNKEEYDYAYDYPEKYAVSKVVGGYDAYKKHTTAINKIEGVKDANGKTKSGSRKTNVINYINDLDIGYVEKLILFRSEYPADDTYNSEIVTYLQDVEWLTYQEKLEILSALGMKVDQNGYVRW